MHVCRCETVDESTPTLGVFDGDTIELIDVSENALDGQRL